MGDPAILIFYIGPKSFGKPLLIGVFLIWTPAVKEKRITHFVQQFIQDLSFPPFPHTLFQKGQLVIMTNCPFNCTKFDTIKTIKLEN